MLTEIQEQPAPTETESVNEIEGINRGSHDHSHTSMNKNQKGMLYRALRIEWLGQTVASLCWIVSVFTYGISEAGDWLQLLAASAWLVANIATLFSIEED